MKVYIGPYTNRWTSEVHHRHMNLKYDYKWDENQDCEDRAWERLEDALQWVYNKTINRYFDYKERKIKIKIHDYDTWSMDNTLAHIIVPMLKQLKETKHGAPYVDDGDVPEELRSTSAPPKENDYDTDDNHFKRWDYVLDEMIYAFEKISNSEWESEFYSGEIDWKFEKDEETNLSRMSYGPNHTFEVDREGMKKVQDRMSNGFLLFGKYYQALWD